jgi:hypothetical protein
MVRIGGVEICHYISATIKVRSDAGSRGAHLAKRIMSEVEVAS